jgi:CHAT domain-containing protein
MILNNIGIVYSNLGRYQISTDHFQKAIDRGLEIGGGQILWEAYLEIANVYRKQGDIDSAILNYKNSIAVIEVIRSQIKLEELKASYLGTDKRLEAYQNLIDVLAERGLLENDPLLVEESFKYLERAKARAFLDSLEISKIQVSTGVPPQLLNRESELMSDISKLYTRLLTTGLAANEKNGIVIQIRELENRIEGLKAEIRAKSPAYAGLKYPQIATIAEARRLIDPGTVCISYSLGKSRSWGFALSRTALKAFSLPSRKDLQQRISDYLKIITDKDAQGFELGRGLYDMLVAPGVDRTLSRLVVIPDDVLFLLPFETLVLDVKGPCWLVENARISYAPSLSSLREIIQKQKSARGRRSMDLLALGSPEMGFDSASTETARASGVLAEIFPSLPFQVGKLRFSQAEVEGIASSFRPKKTTVLLGPKATEDALKSLPLSDYRILHFATHSLIDDANPARSSILLSLDQDPAEDGLFQMREVFETHLRADLVTLSGCRTGLGPFIRGEGIDNLSRAFFFAGASSVLMSLWAVDDEASSHLMGRAYAQLRSARSVEDALRIAQLEMIRSKETRHPYYWGGFVAMGLTDKPLYPDRRPLLAIVVVLAAAIATTALVIKRKRPSML